MTLQSRLASFITSLGADIKNLNTLTALSLPLGPIPQDSGHIAYNQDLLTAQAGSTPVAGTLYICRMVNRSTSAITISSVTVIVASAGASLTNVGFGLWSAAGALLTYSANANGATTTVFTSGGNPRTVTFTTPQVIAAGAAYYVGFWFSGTTPPQLYRSVATNFLINMGTAAPNFRFATTSDTGLTTNPPINLGTQTSGSWAFFVAVG